MCGKCGCGVVETCGLGVMWGKFGQSSRDWLMHRQGLSQGVGLKLQLVDWGRHMVRECQVEAQGWILEENV